jgi:hypothetical protein
MSRWGCPGGAVGASVEIICPCCEAKLVVDAATGEILSIERPKADHAKTFDAAMKDVQTGEQRRDEAFHRAYDRTQRLDDLLSKKFEEAKKKAAKEPGKPRNPLDWE